MTPAFAIPEHVLPSERDLFYRIRGEYLEMPGLRLTVEQAMRLFALDRSTCSQVLEGLVCVGFLSKDGSDRYARSHRGY